MYTVYKHTNKINGKVYIGITKREPKKRWSGGSGYRTCSAMYKAILKYGWDNFEHEILFTDLTYDEACEKEIQSIALYKSNNKKYGYNIEGGGLLNKEISEETRQKLRNKRHTEETKRKIGNFFRGRQMPIEDRKKRSKKVQQYSLDGILIAEFYATREAERQLGIPHNNIALCCKGKYHNAGGYIWKYVGDM